MFLLFLKLPPMHNKTLNTFYLKKLLYKLINLNLNIYNFIKYIKIYFYIINYIIIIYF